jgi:hypothetical protein
MCLFHSAAKRTVRRLLTRKAGESFAAVGYFARLAFVTPLRGDYCFS